MLVPPESPDFNRSLVVWRITDGKPGHEAQTAGLLQALGDAVKVDSYDISASSPVAGFFQWLRAIFPQGGSFPAPDLIIGAGHRTHWSVLAAKRAYKGKAVVLMKPTLPTRLFDLCLVPEHDGPQPGTHIVVTKGVLNPVQKSTSLEDTKGLFLIGGPSKHHGWETGQITQQIQEVLESAPDVSWILTTSRRTPIDCTERLLAMASSRLDVVPAEDTQRGWVAEQLAHCGRVWVSEDSVSMVFEALTAGGEVGLLSVPRKLAHSRVYNAIDSLVGEGYLVDVDGSSAGLSSGEADEQPKLDEAKRCAPLVLSLLG